MAWVEAGALLGIASVLVDLAMQKVMPLHEIYTKLKYEESADFSDLKGDCKTTLEVVERHEEFTAAPTAQEKQVILDSTNDDTGEPQVEKDVTSGLHQVEAF